MAKIEAGKEGSNGSVGVQYGDGPNFVRFGAAGDSRVKLSGGVGVNGQNGNWLGAAGAQASASLKLNGNYVAPVSVPPSSPSSINLKQADTLGGDIMSMTGGTGDLNRLTVGEFNQLREKYPIVFKENQHERFDNFMANANTVAATPAQLLQKAQVQVSGSFSPELGRSGVTPELMNALLKGTSLPDTDITKQTIGSIGDNINQIYSDWHNKYGGAKKIADAIANPDASSGNKELDALVAKHVAKQNLSAAQKQELLARLKSVEAEIDRSKSYVNQVPTAQKVNETYDKIEKILRLEPEVSASVFATGAYAAKNGVVLAGDVSKGVKVDVNNVLATRATPDAPIKYHVYPTHFTRSTVSFGGATGGDTYAALPPELATKLGVTPSGGVGGYISAAQESDRMNGVGSKEQKLALGFNASTKLDPATFGSNTYGYVNAEVASVKNPNIAPKPETKFSLTTGIKW